MSRVLVFVLLASMKMQSSSDNTIRSSGGAEKLKDGEYKVKAMDRTLEKVVVLFIGQLIGMSQLDLTKISEIILSGEFKIPEPLIKQICGLCGRIFDQGLSKKLFDVKLYNQPFAFFSMKDYQNDEYKIEMLLKMVKDSIEINEKLECVHPFVDGYVHNTQFFVMRFFGSQINGGVRVGTRDLWIVFEHKFRDRMGRKKLNPSVFNIINSPYLSKCGVTLLFPKGGKNVTIYKYTEFVDEEGSCRTHTHGAVMCKISEDWIGTADYYLSHCSIDIRAITEEWFDRIERTDTMDVEVERMVITTFMVSTLTMFAYIYNNLLTMTITTKRNPISPYIYGDNGERRGIPNYKVASQRSKYLIHMNCDPNPYVINGTFTGDQDKLNFISVIIGKICTGHGFIEIKYLNRGNGSLSIKVYPDQKEIKWVNTTEKNDGVNTHPAEQQPQARDTAEPVKTRREKTVSKIMKLLGKYDGITAKMEKEAQILPV